MVPYALHISRLDMLYVMIHTTAAINCSVILLIKFSDIQKSLNGFLNGARENEIHILRT